MTILTICVVLYLAPALFLAIIAVGPAAHFSKLGVIPAILLSFLIGLMWPLALYGEIRSRLKEPRS